MRQFFQIFLAVGLICCSSLLFAAESQAAKEIKEILFVDKKEGKDTVHLKVSGECSPKMFYLSGQKPRLVFDFYGVVYSSKAKLQITAAGNYIKKIRGATHRQPETKSRLVIDLKQDHKYTVDQVFLEDDNIYKIVVSHDTIDPPTSEENMKQGRAPETMPVLDDKRKVARQPKASSSASEKEVDVELVEKSFSPQDVKEDISSMEEVTEESNGVTPTLSTILFERSSLEKEKATFVLNGFYPPIVFSVEREELLVVCDFLKVEAVKEITEKIVTAGQFIQEIRIERKSEPKKVRVFLKLDPKYNYDVKQIFFKTKNQFVISVEQIEEKKG